MHTVKDAENPLFWSSLVRQGLVEDQYFWDWTTLGALQQGANAAGRARVISKEEGIWACAGLASACERVCGEIGFEVKIGGEPASGMKIAKNEVIFVLEGSYRGILAAERVMLNLAAYACGIARETRRLVLAVGSKKIRICHTRKILPFYRELVVAAVRAGGGYPHRLSLASGVLIKENHIAVAGSISAAIQGARKVAPHGVRVEVEVKNLLELEEALSEHPDFVLLDNFSPDQVGAAVLLRDQRCLSTRIEVSGGIHFENIGDYAISGVDVISSGAITHSVRAHDFSLLVD